MPKMLIEDQTLENIAEAIREKTGSEDIYTPSQMATAIRNISTGINIPIDSTPTENSENLVYSGGVYQAIQDIDTPQVQANWTQVDPNAVDYIKNKPTIPAAQVQANWTQTNSSAIDYIKNKPNIPSAQIQADWNQTDSSSKAYIKNKPTIPEEQIQADWTQTNSTAVDFIKHKPIIDSTLSSSSTNSIQNKVVYNALQSKQDDLTQVSTVNSILSTDYLYIERNGVIYKVLASTLINISPSEDNPNALNSDNGDSILTESGEELIIDTITE